MGALSAPGADISVIQELLFLKHWVKAVVILKLAMGFATTLTGVPLTVQEPPPAKLTVTLGVNKPLAGYW